MRAVLNLKIYISNVLRERILDSCKNCAWKMSASSGAFAAHKIRKNMEKMKNCPVEKEGALNYSSKYMNSIWGMYNRLSVHNLKQMMDVSQAVMPATVLQDSASTNNNGKLIGTSAIPLTLEMNVNGSCTL